MLTFIAWIVIFLIVISVFPKFIDMIVQLIFLALIIWLFWWAVNQVSNNFFHEAVMNLFR